MKLGTRSIALASVLGLAHQAVALEIAFGSARKEATVKNELRPSWSREQRATGERFRQTWEQVAARSLTAQATPGSPFPGGAEAGKIAEVRARHEAELMRYPNVVGVGEGICTREGKPTGEPCLVVFVDRKIPPARLAKDEILPSRIEGVPVDVVEVGRIEALPR
jgi:hypothetical protein